MSLGFERGGSLFFLSIKLFCRFKKKGNTFLLAVGLSTHLMLAEFLFCIGYKSFAWICDINRI